ncbi:hypothetical protein [Sulfobacillus thermosulfidooxidans]|uniref:hypothetical protein n=1 Tax=Sulfobacillus thermosulfidooxidans TaxID=28034 RepID=UPI0003F5A8D7|nr:hypothetical protein [Sulfobacillus thermosulfidooxidans]
MTDSSFHTLFTIMHTLFDEHATQIVIAELQEHSGRIRAWNQHQRGIAYDLGPGEWHGQLWRSWWQAPNLWRHECVSIDHPTQVISGLLIHDNQWWSYRSLPQNHKEQSKSPVVITHAQDFSTKVPLLSGIGGEDARDNAAKWPWIDPLTAIKTVNWTYFDDIFIDAHPFWHGRAIPIVDNSAHLSTTVFSLFHTGEVLECWIDRESGWPWRFAGFAEGQPLWKLTVTERHLAQDIAPEVFQPSWIFS